MTQGGLHIPEPRKLMDCDGGLGHCCCFVVALQAADSSESRALRDSRGCSSRPPNTPRYTGANHRSMKLENVERQVWGASPLVGESGAPIRGRQSAVVSAHVCGHEKRCAAARLCAKRGQSGIWLVLTLKHFFCYLRAHTRKPSTLILMQCLSTASCPAHARIAGHTQHP